MSSKQIQIVVALQEAFAEMGWDVDVGVSRSVATMPSGYGESGVHIDLMQLSEKLAEALDR
jgi:hypothetical protein